MAEADVKKVEILKEYYDRIEEIVSQSSQFNNVSDYINFVLKEMFSSEESGSYSKEDEEIIKKRLEDLGYL